MTIKIGDRVPAVTLRYLAPDGLKAVFMRIDAMRRTHLEKTAAETMDDFAPSCIAGLSLLGLCGVALFGVRYNPW